MSFFYHYLYKNFAFKLITFKGFSLITNDRGWQRSINKWFEQIEITFYALKVQSFI